uniref:Uncharacterized protein n=1 Tax=Fibrocapsa japonica TaxID=94617 RepID=A0A7S2UYB1_9STRA
MVWNEHDTRVPWVRELQEQIIVPAYPADVPRQQTRLWKAAFEDFIPESFSPLEKQLYTFEQEYTTDTLIGRVLSTSVIASKSDEEKKSISDRVLSLVQRHPEIADKATFMLPHQTVLYVTNKLL